VHPRRLRAKNSGRSTDGGVQGDHTWANACKNARYVRYRTDWPRWPSKVLRKKSQLAGGTDQLNSAAGVQGRAARGVMNSMAMKPDHDSLQSGLLGDVAWALGLKPRDAITRRAAVRSILAAIEGILGTVQRGLLSAAGAELNAPERAFLRNDTRVLAGNGVGNVSHELRLRQRVELTAALLTRLRPDCKVNFRVTGWRELLASLDVGDRLKHAQDLADLDVSDIELAAAVVGYTWLLDNVFAVAQSGFQEPGESGLNELSTLPHALSESMDL
jgi:hypothetical protein